MHLTTSFFCLAQVIFSEKKDRVVPKTGILGILSLPQLQVNAYVDRGRLLLNG